MMEKRAFVTGGTGLLGNNLARLLLQRGWSVRALVRNPEKAHKLMAPEVELVQGDMQNVEPWASALQGIDCLFHTAAYFRESFGSGSHDAQLHAVNVDGTRRLLESAYAAGVRRLVHTSSIAVVTGPRNALIDESMRRPLAEKNAYYRSKIESDRVVECFLEQHPKFFAAFVLPGFLHGPWDAAPTTAGQLTLDFLKRKLPGIPPGTVSFVDVRDASEAALAIAERGERGGRYLAAGRHLSIRSLLNEYAAVTGQPAPARSIPRPLFLAIGALSELVARISGKEALISLATARLVLQEEGRTCFSDARYTQELGLTFRPIRETLADEIAWFRSNGYV